ncbi:MAG: hypothetical protein DRJ43_04275 [Thermoprotei archaeon]|nr:MAG: hypothetical protein DRJ43_04275 [Thermoprotei archaeon]
MVFDSLDEALERVEEVVAEKWGFRLRPYQRRCVAQLLLTYCREGSRVNMPLTIVLLPTGSGKSLIFQSVARVLRRRIGGTTVVVSPLLALIEDQVYSLRRRGIRVCRITGLVDSSTRSRLIRGLARGEYDLVYITPEQFQKEIVRRSFEKADINYIILDEIHTLSKWGRSFRPSYIYLAEYLRKKRSEGFWIPIAGFTATLPSGELEAVLKVLSGAEGFDIDEIGFSTDYDHSVAEMKFQVKVIKGPVLRDNITINVIATPAGESRLKYLAKVVRDLIDWSEEVSGGRPWIGIVYTGFVRSTREYENVETIAEYLSQVLNEKVGYFHGQLDRREKKRILDSLYMVSRGVIRYPRIIVATKAFGMGVDIPNIRWIVHYIMPETVEDYYQEIGRGGRDGELCRAVMLFSPGYDFRRRYTLLKRSFIDPRVVFVIHEFLARYAGTDARIPLVILCLLVHNFMYGNTWKYVAYGRTLPERVDTCVRKSLNLMARLGILDYDIIYDRFVVTDDEVSAGVRIAKIGNKDLYLATLKDVKHDGSLYDAYVVGLYGGSKLGGYDALVKFIPEGLPGNLRLLIKPAGGNGEELGLRITGAKEAVLINYLVPQINRRDAYDLVRREQFYEMVALFYMNNYAETVMSKPADERDKVARMLIKEYLSRSIKDLYREFISEKKMKLAYVNTEVFRMYNTLIKKGRLNLWVRYRDKKMLAEFMAYLTLIHFLEKEYPPNSIAVVLPYGYRSSFVESFRELYGMLGMPLIEPETVIVKRSDIYRLKDIVLDLSRMPQVFILASNYTLKRLAYNLENSSGSSVYTVCVKR